MRRIVTAREQAEMLSPWHLAAEGPTEAPPDIHDLLKNVEDGNGRWVYRHQETSGDMYKRHEYRIDPATSPATHTYQDEWGHPHTVHYDPELTGGQVPSPGRFHHEWPDPHALRNEITDLVPPQGMLWRGMSQEEYDLAKQRGYFESDGNHNLGDEQAGLTFFSTNPGQAGNYATWFAPMAYKPTFTHPGHVVGIPDRPELPRGPLPSKPDPTSTEVGVPGRIPFSEVTHHYIGHPSVIDSGRRGASESWNGWEDSGSQHPSSQIMWRQGSGAHRTATSSGADYNGQTTHLTGEDMEGLQWDWGRGRWVPRPPGDDRLVPKREDRPFDYTRKWPGWDGWSFDQEDSGRGRWTQTQRDYESRQS